MNRRGLFTGLAGALAVPVAAVLPKAEPEMSQEAMKFLEAFLQGYNEAQARMDAGDFGPELIIPPTA